MNQEQPQKTAEVQELTWAMSTTSLRRAVRSLNDLLASDDQARQLYVECVQLHADLAQMLCRQQGDGAASTVPIPPGRQWRLRGRSDLSRPPAPDGF